MGQGVLPSLPFLLFPFFSFSFPSQLEWCSQSGQWSKSVQKSRRLMLQEKWEDQSLSPSKATLSSLQDVKLRPTGVFTGRPSRLEVTSWKYAEINICYSHLQALSKDIAIRAALPFSALETIQFSFNGLYIVLSISNSYS